MKNSIFWMNLFLIDYSKRLARDTEFLELASMRQFQDRFIDCLNFEEDDDD